MAQINKPNTYFNTVLYTGDGTQSNSITGVGFQPDLVWTKGRSGTYGASNNKLVDVVRGAGKTLHSNLTDSEYDQSSGSNGSTISLDSDGFTLGDNSNSNHNGTTFVSWNWLANNTSGSSNTDGSITSTVSANTTSGFSIVSWTGTGANATVGHGLGVAPKVVIVKNRTDVTNWHVYHGAINGMSGGYITLNNTDGFLTNVTDIWNGNHSSTIVNLGSNNNSNGSSDSMIAYCFAEKKGFSKFAKYTGNGSTDGTFVYTGFKPAFILHKRTESISNWFMFDNKRLGYNPSSYRLMADLTEAEASGGEYDILSNGFKIRFTSGNVNASGASYIYMAFAEQPLVGTNNIPATAR